MVRRREPGRPIGPPPEPPTLPAGQPPIDDVSAAVVELSTFCDQVTSQLQDLVRGQLDLGRGAAGQAEGELVDAVRHQVATAAALDERLDDEIRTNLRSRLIEPVLLARGLGDQITPPWEPIEPPAEAPPADGEPPPELPPIAVMPEPPRPIYGHPGRQLIGRPLEPGPGQLPGQMQGPFPGQGRPIFPGRPGGPFPGGSGQWPGGQGSFGPPVFVFPPPTIAPPASGLPSVGQQPPPAAGVPTAPPASPPAAGQPAPPATAVPPADKFGVPILFRLMSDDTWSVDLPLDQYPDLAALIPTQRQIVQRTYRSSEPEALSGDCGCPAVATPITDDWG